MPISKNGIPGTLYLAIAPKLGTVNPVKTYKKTTKVRQKNSRL